MKAKAKQLKQGYTFTKNNYTLFYSAGRYFYTALYKNESAYTLKELKRIVLINHSISI
jgi:hypothetical protein